MLQRRTLRAMKRRWIADYDRLIEAYPIRDWEDSDADIETERNLVSAIAWIDGLITAVRPGDKPGQST